MKKVGVQERKEKRKAGAAKEKRGKKGREHTCKTAIKSAQEDNGGNEHRHSISGQAWDHLGGTMARRGNEPMQRNNKNDPARSLNVYTTSCQAQR